MNKMWITIPYSVELTDANVWQNQDDRTYYICRGHYLLFDRQISCPIATGEKISQTITPNHVMQERLVQIEQEYSIINVEETIKEILTSNETIVQTMSSLSSELKVPEIIRLGQAVKFNATEKLSQALHSTSKHQASQTSRVTTTFSSKYQISPTEKDRKLVFSYGFQRRAYDVYLVFIDYLKITYERSILGMRKKINKYPKPTTSRHSNIYPVKAPLGSIQYWQLIPDLQVIDAENYKLEVEDPYEMTVHPIERIRKPAVDYPRGEPTLYQISRAAFPFKWVDRKGPWTRDELSQIEFDEAAREGTWWFFQHGPGKKKKQKSHKTAA
ncbi:MAG: hypothetical protein EHM64_02975 [Ignavibacteriae bacterium]|nr:MAG: hypothetical protein EHM64_02975 [Ignavibacteriota bacterium]